MLKKYINKDYEYYLKINSSKLINIIQEQTNQFSKLLAAVLSLFVEATVLLFYISFIDLFKSKIFLGSILLIFFTFSLYIFFSKYNYSIRLQIGQA